MTPEQEQMLKENNAILTDLMRVYTEQLAGKQIAMKDPDPTDGICPKVKDGRIVFE